MNARTTMKNVAFAPAAIEHCPARHGKTAMKNVAFAFAAIVFISNNAWSQYPVTDVGAIAQDAANQVVNLGKYVEMINNQVQQISLLTNELNQITAYTQAFGDPASIQKIVGADQLVNSINRTGVGQPIGQLQRLSNGVQALQYTGNGLYRAAGSNFTTPSGVTVPRNADLYRQFDAINRTTGNYSSVYDDVSNRRQELKGQI